MLEEIPAPIHKDLCNNGSECYVGSFSTIYYNQSVKTTIEELIDLYIYPDNLFGQCLCLRFGSEPSQYYSPLSVLHMARSADKMEAYSLALRMLQEKGTFIWQRK